MTHILVRAECRENEKRVGITPLEAAHLLKKGIKVSVEDSNSRIIPSSKYRDVGCEIIKEKSWPNAPLETIIFGLKELPDEPFPLKHRHIMFGHAFKDQPMSETLLKRFKVGGGTLYDIEYLVSPAGKRVAAFGYWAGYAGAAVTISCWVSQKLKKSSKVFAIYNDKDSLDEQIRNELESSRLLPKSAIVIGALGRVGSGVIDLCEKMNIKTTKWDIKETKEKEAFIDILNHDLFFNCVVANKETPTFISEEIIQQNQNLSIIGDIACDPGSEHNPIALYDSVTTWSEPVTRVSEKPILDVMAIDNLPSLLPLESSVDFASQLLPSLLELDKLNQGVWLRAHQTYLENVKRV